MLIAVVHWFAVMPKHAGAAAASNQAGTESNFGVHGGKKTCHDLRENCIAEELIANKYSESKKKKMKRHMVSWKKGHCTMLVRFGVGYLEGRI